VVHANSDGYTLIVMLSSYAANAAPYKLPALAQHTSDERIDISSIALECP
jgi:hypothetical protein